MSVLDCGHTSDVVQRVCQHVKAQPQPYRRKFTGRGVEFVLVCLECAALGDAGASLEMQHVCPACFEECATNGSCHGHVGQPQVLERSTKLWFVDRRLPLWPASIEIVAVAPIPGVDRNLWAVATGAGQLMRVDFDAHDGACDCVCDILQPSMPDDPQPPGISFREPLVIHVSPDGTLAAVANLRGRYGVVVDLPGRRVLWNLDRQDGEVEHCNFSLAFVERDGRTLLIHATEWNRLDISDARTGELLTARTIEPPPGDGTRPAHDLDYFHCGLAVSPGGQWIVDNGWRWHPVGVVVAWSLDRWLRKNVWESENGESQRTLRWCSYYWDGPWAWLDERRLVLGGIGEDEPELIPAAQIFDIEDTTQAPRWFAGPAVAPGAAFHVEGHLLLSWAPAQGVSVWDLQTGERLLHDRALSPLAYHPGRRAFLSQVHPREFILSTLAGQPFDAATLAWQGGTVRKLAEAIAAEHAYDRLPILADALEEAGCADAELLAHCRAAGTHGKGCWAVERILTAEQADESS